MKIETMHDLYVMELQDLYSAEKQLVAALPKMEAACTDKKLKQAISEHLKATEEQKARIGEIMAELGEDPEAHECIAMRGLIKEGENVLKDVKDPQVCDAAIIAAAQRVEHYEIAGYGVASTYAETLGYAEHEKLLQKSLAEEKEADQMLNKLALTSINQKAMGSEKSGKAYVK